MGWTALLLSCSSWLMFWLDILGQHWSQKAASYFAAITYDIITDIEIYSALAGLILSIFSLRTLQGKLALATLFLSLAVLCWIGFND